MTETTPRGDGRAAPVRVLYVQYTDPAAYPPIEHSAALLAESGCDVCVLGTSLLEGALTLAAPAAVRLEMLPAEAPGWRQKVHYLRFVWWTAASARRFRPAWIYASDPLSSPAALVAAALTGARVVYHEHDSPDRTGAARSGVMRLVDCCRRILIRRAAICVLPSEARARRVSAETGRADVVTIWNTPLAREVAAARTRLSGGLRVFYHGSIVASRLPLTLIAALARLPGDVTLTIAGYDPAGGRHVAALRAEAERHGVASRVVLAGTVPARADLLALAATCDVGLSLLPSRPSDSNEQTMVGASNKPFDYMACGLALLVPDTVEWRQTYVEPGFARACVPESVESVTAALAWYREHAEECRRMGERGRRQIADVWNYDRTFERVRGEIAGEASAAGARAVVADARAAG